MNQSRVMVCIVNRFADFVHCDSQKLAGGELLSFQYLFLISFKIISTEIINNQYFLSYINTGEEKEDFTKPGQVHREEKFGVRNEISVSNSVDHDEDNDSTIAAIHEMSSGMDKVAQFLVWANGVRPIVGLQAYRYRIIHSYNYVSVVIYLF